MKELLKRDLTYENIDIDGSAPQEYLKDISLETAPYSFDKDGGVSLANCMEEQEPSTTIGPTGVKHKKAEHVNRNTPLLIAAKNGVIEMVEEILKRFPVAIHDVDNKKKNILLLAVENRQSQLYELLLKKSKIERESLFRKVDYEGNSALHLAARLGDYNPWPFPGEALLMHWEIKWFSYIEESMPSDFFGRHNIEYKTPKEIFSETHQKLVEKGGEWLKRISESCTVVAALIATVAFSTSSNVPGGFQEGVGTPILQETRAFKVFAVSSLIALCCSVFSVILFLSMLTSRNREQDFGNNLPKKLVAGYTSLFLSVTFSMVSFCAGHFYIDKLGSLTFPVYAIIFTPVAFFPLAQFPLYLDAIRAIKKVPDRGHETFLR
ncbi:hypothetical protein Fmac_008979 [Flemingia macrophylla]|uniref:PGG domain-containing protein n=1 Tax=Flemingia macrophylla TaxID=520843 RepID=A0ABD1MZ02_9FABA